MFDRRPNCNPGADVSAAKEADTIDGQFQIRGKIRMTTTGPFELDPRLKADTLAITKLGLCELRLMNDRRWPWLLLVPQRAGVSEFFDLTPLDQTMLSFEVGLVAKPFKALTGCDKLNIATIGNVVSQFHCHIVARSDGDSNWPRPVWGFGSAEPYETEAAKVFIDDISRAVMPV